MAANFIITHFIVRMMWVFFLYQKSIKELSTKIEICTSRESPGTGQEEGLKAFQ